MNTQAEAAPRPDDDAERLLTVQDLAERYGVAPQTVYSWNHYRTGPRYTRAGRLPRYRLSDVIAWEDQRMRGDVAGK